MTTRETFEQAFPAPAAVAPEPQFSDKAAVGVSKDFARQRTADLEHFETYAAFHVSNGPEWQMYQPFVPQVAQFLADASAENPDIREAVTQSLDQALAMTDDAYLAALARGTGDDELALLTEAALQRVIIEGAEVAFAERMFQHEENVRGSWYATTEDRRGKELAVSAAGSIADAFSFDSTLATAGSWAHALVSTPGEWVTSGHQLGGRITLEDGSTQTFLINLDRGTQIRTNADAQKAMVLAFAGLAHETDASIDRESSSFGAGFIQTVANSPGIRQSMYNAAASMPGTNVILAASEVGLIEPRQPAELDIEQMVASNMPDHQLLGVMMASVDEQLRSEGVVLAAPELHEVASEVFGSGEEFDRLREMSVDEIMAEAAQAGEEQDALTTAFDFTVEKVFQVADVWESVTQFIGVQTIDALAGAVDVSQAASTGDTEGALTALQETFTLAEESTVGDYFGLSGGARDWVNLGASIVFDPANLMFGGGATRRIMMEALVTNPSLAPMAMRTRAMRGWVDDLMLSASGASTLDDGAVRAIAAVEGMRDDATLRLLDLVESGTATRAEIEAVIMSEFPSGGTGGTFIPGSFGHATRRATGEGIANLLRALPGMDAEGTERVGALVVALSDDASVPVTGSRGGDAVKRTLITLFADDPENMVRHLRSYLDAVGGNTRTMQNLQALRTENNQQLIELAQSTVDGAPGTRVQGYDRELVQSQIDTTQQMMAGASGEAREFLAEDLARLTDIRDQIDARRVAIDENLAEGTRIKTEIERMQAWMAQPHSQSDSIIWWHEFYDELADDLGVPTTADHHPVLEGKFKRDWSVVTGRDAAEQGPMSYPTVTPVAREAGLLPPPGSVPAEELERLSNNLSELDVLSRASYFTAPVTPWEIMTYRALKDDPNLHQQFFAALNRARNTKTINLLRTIFNTSLLINLSTPMKTRLDESLRLLADTGNVEDFLRSTLAILPGADTLGRTPSDEAVQFARETAGGIESTQGGWQMVTNDNPNKPPKGWMDSAERFLNGSLANDDMARVWARVQSGGTLTSEEIVELQARYQGRTVFTDVGADEGGRTVVSEVDDMVQAFDEVMESWLSRVIDDDAIRDQFRARIIEVLTTDGRFAMRGSGTPDARLARHLKFLPMAGPDAAQVSGQKAGVFGPAWNALYGMPGQRAGGVFYDNYFDWALDLYTKSYEQQGRLITPQLLVDRFGLDIADANAILKRGTTNGHISTLVGEGYATPSYLRAQAADYARARSQDLMYNLVSRSIAGTALDNPLMLPFLRAQTDFLGYWGRQFTEGNVTRVPREKLLELSQGNMLQRAVGAGIAGAERVPINIRLLGRWANLAAAADTGDEFAEPGTPGWFLNRFTFLPLRRGPGFLMNVVPQPGSAVVAPWWMLEQHLDDPGWMEAIRRVFPSLGYIEQNLGANPDPLDALNVIAPIEGDRTVFGLVNNVAHTASRLPGVFGAPFDGLAGVMSEMRGMSDPPGMATAMRINLGASDIFEHRIFSPEWFAAVAEVDEQTRQQLETREGARGLISQIPGLGSLHFDAGHIEYMLPLVRGADEGGYLEILEAAGKLTDADRTALFGPDGLIAKYEQETATRDELVDLMDLMGTLLFQRAADVDFIPSREKRSADGEIIGVTQPLPLIDLMLVENPALAFNMVSNERCVPGRDGSFFSGTHCSLDGRIQNVPEGQEGRDMRAQWRRDGVIGYHPASGKDGWVADAWLRVETAKGRVARALWLSMTGREYGQGMTVALEDRTLEPSETTLQLAEKIGLVLPDGPVSGTQMRTAFSNYLNNALQQSDINATFWDSDVWSTFGNNHDIDPETGEAAPWSLPEAAEWRKKLETAMKREGWSLYDLPEEARAVMRDNLFGPALSAGVITQGQYDAQAARIFGDIDWEPPQPPALGSDNIDFQLTFDGDRYRQDFHVVDGDTITGLDQNGDTVAFRLIGLNAPENGQPGHLDAMRGLESLIQNADRVDLVMFDVDQFGRIQTFEGGRQRIKVWLYVDGVPIYDPSVFTSSNPAGLGFGGTIPDYEGIFNAGRPEPVGAA